MMEVRLTVAVIAVLRLFMADPTQPRYGYDLMNATGFSSGKLYPILARLRRNGWLKPIETTDPSGGRPRICYVVPPSAIPEIRQHLAEVAQLMGGTSPASGRGKLSLAPRLGDI